MADPRQGRAGASGYSPRLAKAGREPRQHSSASGTVSDADIGDGLARDNQGRTRIAALDGLRPLSPNATLAEVIARQNQIVRLLRGS